MRLIRFLALLLTMAIVSAPGLAKERDTAKISKINKMSQAESDKEVLLVYPDRLLVIDSQQPDDGGPIPQPGKVEQFLLVRSRPLLVLSIPSKATLNILDVRPFSPTKFQVLASYQSPELGQKGLSLVESLNKVYLLKDRMVVARLDLDFLRLELELSKYESLPLFSKMSQIQQSESGRLFYLEGGDLLYEETRPPTLPAPRPIPLESRPVDLLLDGDRLFVLESQGKLKRFDAKTLDLQQELSLGKEANSMAFLRSDRLAVLASDGTLFILDTRSWRWIRQWKPDPKRSPLRLLPL